MSVYWILKTLTVLNKIELEFLTQVSRFWPAGVEISQPAGFSCYELMKDFMLSGADVLSRPLGRPRTRTASAAGDWHYQVQRKQRFSEEYYETAMAAPASLFTCKLSLKIRQEK